MVCSRPVLKAQLLLKTKGITDEEYKQIVEADKVFRQVRMRL